MGTGERKGEGSKRIKGLGDEIRSKKKTERKRKEGRKGAGGRFRSYIVKVK